MTVCELLARLDDMEELNTKRMEELQGRLDKYDDDLVQLHNTMEEVLRRLTDFEKKDDPLIKLVWPDSDSDKKV